MASRRKCRGHAKFIGDLPIAVRFNAAAGGGVGGGTPGGVEVDGENSAGRG